MLVGVVLFPVNVSATFSCVSQDLSTAGSSCSEPKGDLQTLTPLDSSRERERREESCESASSLTGEVAQKEQLVSSGKTVEYALKFILFPSLPPSLHLPSRAIKNFKLDPKAKEFVLPAAFISPPLSSSATPFTSSVSRSHDLC